MTSCKWYTGVSNRFKKRRRRRRRRHQTNCCENWSKERIRYQWKCLNPTSFLTLTEHNLQKVLLEKRFFFLKRDKLNPGKKRKIQEPYADVNALMFICRRTGFESQHFSCKKFLLFLRISFQSLADSREKNKKNQRQTKNTDAFKWYAKLSLFFSLDSSSFKSWNERCSMNYVDKKRAPLSRFTICMISKIIQVSLQEIDQHQLLTVYMRVEENKVKKRIQTERVSSQSLQKQTELQVTRVRVCVLCDSLNTLSLHEHFSFKTSCRSSFPVKVRRKEKKSNHA